MGSAQRRETILAHVRNLGGYATVGDLARLTGVSPITIRRDANELMATGAVERSRGAIRLLDRGGVMLEPSFLRRSTASFRAKQAIAVAAAARVRPGSTIAIDTGTTTLAFSQQLTAVENLTVVTSSLVVATQTADRHTVHVLAGRVRPDELSVVGPQATASARDLFLDQVFLGAAGVAESVFDYSLDDAYTKRALIAQAQEVVLLCDASKFDERAAAFVCELETISTLVTDAPPSAQLGRRLNRAGVEIVIAPEEKT